MTFFHSNDRSTRSSSRPGPSFSPAQKPQAPRPDNRPDNRPDQRTASDRGAFDRSAPPRSTVSDETIAASPFTALGLSKPLVRALVDEEYSEPTPVQMEVIPKAIAGRDVLAAAQTGTGKTAAFVLPVLQHLSDLPPSGSIQALILTPTRELAAQIAERVTAYGRYLNIRHAVIYGGVSQRPQEAALRRRPALMVATPGRLLDLLNQRLVNLAHVSHFVLDEADRMLDMGFIHDVRKVIALLPEERQTLLFSATIPPTIETLANQLLEEPARVSISPKIATAEGVDQAVIHVEHTDKRSLIERFLQRPDVTRTIVFTRTKHGANRLAEQLDRAGIGAMALHGNKSQGARERALGSFRNGQTRVLVATDVAARGIDVDGISHVINFDIPNVPESYVHRIGRTGRAGAFGKAVSFCARDERSYLSDIERLIRQSVPVVDEHGNPAARPAPEQFPQAGPAARQRQGGGGGGNRYGSGPNGSNSGRPRRRW